MSVFTDREENYMQQQQLPIWTFHGVKSPTEHCEKVMIEFWFGTDMPYVGPYYTLLKANVIPDELWRDTQRQDDVHLAGKNVRYFEYISDIPPTHDLALMETPPYSKRGGWSLSAKTIHPLKEVRERQNRQRYILETFFATLHLMYDEQKMLDKPSTNWSPDCVLRAILVLRADLHSQVFDGFFKN